MLRPRLEMITKKLEKTLPLPLENLLNSLLLRLEMMTTGSQMRISMFNSMTQILLRNLRELILKLESLLSMMISQDKFALKKPSKLKLLPQRKLLRLLLLERMDQMERLRSTTRLLSLINLLTLLPKELTMFMLKIALPLFKERHPRLLKLPSSKERMRRQEMNPSEFNFLILDQLEPSFPRNLSKL